MEIRYFSNILSCCTIHKKTQRKRNDRNNTVPVCECYPCKCGVSEMHHAEPGSVFLMSKDIRGIMGKIVGVGSLDTRVKLLFNCYTRGMID